jgi:ParB family chromosome partitioning protein
MKIALSEIRGMDRRVRQQMSPEKLEELADSLKEVGQVCPVKVRKNGHGYTLVYGHRRVMAAKAAGLKEIEAIVDDVPEDKLLTQALIENVIREDMNAADTADALNAIKAESGKTWQELAAYFGWTEGHIVGLAGISPAESKVIRGSDRSELGLLHVKKARLAGDDAVPVLKKAASEGLSARQTERVAEVVKRARDYGGQKAVQRVLSQKADDILRSHNSLPAYKPKPKAPAQEVKGSVLFQWIKDPRVIVAEESLKAVSKLVSVIARSTEDRAGAKIVLKNLRKMARNVADQLDSVVGRS